MEDITTTLGAAAETTEAVADALSSGIAFEPMNFVSNLQYMGMGMLGIFIVIAAIWGVTVALNKIFASKPEKDGE
jgi:hypothetical protein